MSTNYVPMDLQMCLINIIKSAIKEAYFEMNTSPVAISEKYNDKLTLTIQETSELTGIGRDKILELVHRANTDFPYFKVGSKCLNINFLRGFNAYNIIFVSMYNHFII
jgi:hypothetical protein